jgi:hypothetical protein
MRKRKKKIAILGCISLFLISSLVLLPVKRAKTEPFLPSQEKVFYDKNTGLEWLAGPDKPTNWYDAKRWVESLTSVAGGGWRMPTLKELKTLYQKGEKCNIRPFFKTTGCWIWSGETKDSSSAWIYDYSYDPGSSILSGGSGSGGYKVFLNRNDSKDTTRCFAVRFRK